MNVFKRFSLKNHNFGHFVIIALILLVGFSIAVYFLKHPVVKISKDSPIVITETEKQSTDDEQSSKNSQNSANTSVNTSSPSVSVPQTGMPVTGQSDGFYSLFLISIFSFVMSKYLLSLVNLRRYF